ncbi:hypothetical protein Hdeb2414_s0026g00678331 [Helianthus debilis subsp. tardiflorus]
MLKGWVQRACQTRWQLHSVLKMVQDGDGGLWSLWFPMLAVVVTKTGTVPLHRWRWLRLIDTTKMVVPVHINVNNTLFLITVVLEANRALSQT